MSEFIRVLGVNELQPGGCTIVVANSKEIALFNVNGTFHAIENSCTHRGGPLGQGDLEGCVVSCPWHGWTFDVTSGTSLINEEFSVPKYDVQVQGEDVLVKV
ncbi:MAG TPA: Rieske 2Fe-2S domain-containing protein [Blastocatellia bacterium]|nr:Rieske 2Fe-2S domain-containing protein [Blastocatellia bacterium]